MNNEMVKKALKLIRMQAKRGNQEAIRWLHDNDLDTEPADVRDTLEGEKDGADMNEQKHPDWFPQELIDRINPNPDRSDMVDLVEYLDSVLIPDAYDPDSPDFEMEKGVFEQMESIEKILDKRDLVSGFWYLFCVEVVESFKT